MNPDPHQQARSWLQQQLDGQLEAASASLLQEHLRACGSCRDYAARMEHLDSALQGAYQERLLAGQSQWSQPLSVESTLHRQMGLKMKRMQVTKFAMSLLYIAVAAMTILGFTWLVSTRGRMVLPGAVNTFTPTPTPIPPTTPTPLSWTEDHPLTSADQIISLLDDLAARNADRLGRSGWVHVVRTDQSGPGMIRSYYSESWSRYPQDDQLCMDSMSWIKEKPESSNIVQLLVGTSDGLFGDLIQLRNKSGHVSHSEPGYYSCSLKPEFTAAGEMAARLRDELALTSDGTVDARAWYTEQDGKPLLFVAITLPNSSQANSTGITGMRRSFDLETGNAVQEGTRMVNPDGSLFGESLQGVETTFVTELPAEIATQFEQYAKELRTHAVTVPTSIPDTSPVPVVEDQQFIPESAPLDDGPTILRILQALKQRQLERLSVPGWYVYGPDVPNPDDWTSNYYLLTHTIDQSGACDFMSYYIKDGKILPQELMLYDGRWATIDVANGGEISPGPTGEVHWNDGTVTTACQVPDVNTISYLQTEIDRLQALVNGQKPGTFIAWTQGIGRGQYFVIYTEEPEDGLTTVMDPDTHKLEPIARQQTWSYFNLYWGTVIPEATQMVFQLQNGKTIGSLPAPDKTVNVGYHYYQNLPPDLQQAFDKGVTELDALVPK